MLNVWGHRLAENEVIPNQSLLRGNGMPPKNGMVSMFVVDALPMMPANLRLLHTVSVHTVVSLLFDSMMQPIHVSGDKCTPFKEIFLKTD